MQISGIFSKKILPNLNGGFLCILACMFCTPFPAMAEGITLQLEGHYNYMLRYEEKCESTGIAYSCATGTENEWYENGDALNGVGTTACVHLEFDRSITRNNKTYLLNCRNVIEMSSSSLGCKPANCSGGTTPSGSQIYDGCWDANGGAASQSCFNCMGPASGSSQNCPSQCWAAGPCSVWGNYPGVSDSGAMSCKQGCVFYCPYKTYGKPWVPSGIVAGEPSDWANTAAEQMDCRAWPENFYYEASKNYYNPSTTYNKCAAGYYKSARGVPGQAFVSDCYECPQADVEVSSDVSGKNDIFSCYIPRNTRFSDESGSGHYVDNCDY